MKTFNLNGWQRIGIVLSAGWMFFVVYAVIINYQQTDLYNEVISRTDCNFSHPPFFTWYDKKTGLSLSDTGRQITLVTPAITSKNTPTTPAPPTGFISCIDISQIIDASINSKDIIPYPHLNYGFTVCVLFLPIIAFWVGIYFCVHILKWIVRGFRNK